MTLHCLLNVSFFVPLTPILPQIIILSSIASCIFLPLPSKFSSQVLTFSWHCSNCPYIEVGFPGGSVVKNPPANAGDAGFNPGLGRSPGEGTGTPPLVFLPGKSFTQRSLMDYSSWGRRRVRHILATK